MNQKHRLPFRQIHLDFHTHASIDGVGAKFDEANFSSCLKAGQIDSITLFAKCHHGWSYYDTKVGVAHPNLKTNLLERQIAVCREIGIRFQVYLSAGYDEVIADQHPDWIVHSPEGPLKSESPFFRPLRFNSPYLEYLAKQAEEVTAFWPDAGGIFFDIIKFIPDFSDDSLRALEERHLSPEDPAQMAEYSREVLEGYYSKINNSVFNVNPEMGVFHNSGHIRVGNRWIVAVNSHLEIESLPTGGWGYDHFPLSAAYANNLHKEFLGMTGKFHGSWGEFGGFKRKNALSYECSTMLAAGARCSIGDQLHPNGLLDVETYRAIGSVYGDVKRKEEFVIDGRQLSKIAVYSAEVDANYPRDHSKSCFADEGIARMLLELQQPFSLLDQETDWSGYDVIILPDAVALTAELEAKIGVYLRSGGKILASGYSLLDQKNEKFIVDVGADYVGPSIFNPEYLLISEDRRASIPVYSPIVIHGPSINIAVKDAEILVRRVLPSFNRSWEHFCGHQHAPPDLESEYPAAVYKNGIVYFAHQIFTRYRLYGQPLYRDFVEVALRELLGREHWFETSLPRGGRLYISEQKFAKRHILHLLHGVPSLRGGGEGEFSKPVEVIEDQLPLFNVSVRIPLMRKYVRAMLFPEQRALPISIDSYAVEFIVPQINGHQIISLEYDSDGD